MKILREDCLDLTKVDSCKTSLLVKELILDEVHNPTDITKSLKLVLEIDLGIVKQKVVCDVPKDLKDLLLQYYIYLGGK